MKIIYKILLSVLIFIYIVQLYSCTENSQVPQNNSEIKIEFINTVKDLNAGTCSYPAENAEITIVSISNGEENQIGNISANEHGIAEYTLNAESSSSVYYFISTYNNFTQRSQNYSLCDNDTTIHFCFENTQPFQICCKSLSDTTINIDEEIIISNSNELLVTLFSNSCNEPIEVSSINYNDFPLIVDKFISNNILLNESNIIINNNSNIAVLFDINEIPSGKYEGDILLNIECLNSSAEIKFHIKIELKEPDCSCPKFKDSNEIIIWGKDILEYGEEIINEYFIMKNTLSCDITITNIELLKNNIPINYGNNSWQPVPININKTFSSGENIFIDFQFTPLNPGKNIDTLLLHAEINNKVCVYKLICIGNSCQTSCMKIDNEPFNNQVNKINDTRRYSNSSNCFEINEDDSNEFNFSIRLDDMSCSPERLAINVDSIDAASLKFFNFNTDTLNFLSGQEINYSVQFNPPTIEEFFSIFTSGIREKTNTEVDSIFSIKIDFVPQNYCQNSSTIFISLKMHNKAYLSNQYTLESYDQFTWNSNNEVSDPSYNVFKIDKIHNGMPGIINDLSNLPDKPNPNNIAQQYGDLFVTVENTDLPNNPPQPTFLPLLGLTKGEGQKFKKIILLSEDVNVNNFNKIDNMINNIKESAQANSQFFNEKLLNSPIRYINQGDLYMIFTETMNGIYPCEIALIYINQVLIGETNNDTYKRSGIKFQMIYPIILN